MGNTTNNFSVIRVTPTLDTGAYADNDVFFNPTAIPNAVIGNGGCSKLLGISILNEDDADIILAQLPTEKNETLEKEKYPVDDTGNTPWGYGRDPDLYD